MDSKTRLEVILDKRSNEETLIENVKKLDHVAEPSHFWADIVRDRSYSATHRRIVIVQYFIRHSLYRRIYDLRLHSLGLSPAEYEIEFIRLVAGFVPVRHEIEDRLISITFKFGEMDVAAVYFSIFPDCAESETDQIMLGARTDANQVIMDVGACEQLRSGGRITWRAWRRHQIYEQVKKGKDGKTRIIRQKPQA